MPSITNLTVHGIGTTSRKLDEGEDATWVGVGQFERVLDAVVGRDDVRITFDDGNASDLEIGLPRLLERGLTAEFYVLAGLLGEPGRLTEDDVRTLAEAGMTIGSHGWAHRDWRRIRPDQDLEEFTRARQVLADLIGRPVTRVAIPFGSYDRNVLRRLRGTGVSRAYTSDGGPARAGAWLQPRTSLRWDLGDAWIEEMLSGSPAPRVRARQRAAQLVKRMR
jgi:peptidoglycan/xylan/chitin deacetylase (PgdA/CDA1 family)